MSSLSAKDRVSLCLFSFSDGRRCRTPRTGNHPHFCFYHAQKEARAQAAEKLGNELACFFSGDYLSACDLSTALSRLIPAVVRGDINPKLARTVAYLSQTLMQSIHLSQHEYINAFGTDNWRKSIRNGVNANYDHRFPSSSEPQPQQPATSTPQQSAPSLTQLPNNAQPTRPTSALARSSASISRPASPPLQSSSAADKSTAQTCDPINPPPTQETPRTNAPNRDLRAVHFDQNYRLRPSSQHL